MRYVIALFCLLSVTACDGNPTEPTAVDAELILAPGQVRSVRGTAIKFEQVVSDNRCPANANCVIAGSAEVRIRVQAFGRSAQSYELSTANPRSIEHRDFRIELLEVAPYPFSNQPIDPATYRITLHVTRQG